MAFGFSCMLVDSMGIGLERIGRIILVREMKKGGWKQQRKR